jgi:hypothetical protein
VTLLVVLWALGWAMIALGPGAAAGAGDVAVGR